MKDLTHTEMHEIIESFIKSENASVMDVSKKSILDVITCAILSDNKTIQSMINGIFPSLLKYLGISFKSLSYLSKNGKLSSDQQKLFLIKVAKSAVVREVDYIDPLNVEVIINFCIKQALSEKTTEAVVARLISFENRMFQYYLEEYQKIVFKLPIFDEYFKKMTTKQLLSEYKKNRSSLFTKNPYDEYSSIRKYYKRCLKKELNSREHILKKSQTDLIKKMSIHSGQKLDLKQAQDLNNRLKKKNHK